MSLINDALKKAQKQRTGDGPPLAHMPGVGGETASRIAKRDKPAGINTQLLRLALTGGGVLVVVVVGGVFLFRSLRSPQPSASPAPAAPAHATAVPLDKAPDPKPALAEATPSVAFRLPAAAPVDHAPVTTPAPSPIPASQAPSSSEAGHVTPSAPSSSEAGSAGLNTPSSPPPSAPPAAPTPPPQMDAKALTYIDNLRIAGIRAAGADSKVLMNDRVYRIGDIVDRELGLKLTGITANSLTFEDQRGGSYTRQF